MDLSIIVTHHQTLGLLDLCLKSINDTIGSAIKYEILVVDSESQEQTKQFIKERYGVVKFISFKQNVGYSKLVNSGLKKTKGRYILILNADIIVLDEAVKKMVNYFREHPETGIVAPQLLDFTNNIQFSCFSFPTFEAILARRTFWGKTKRGKRALNKFALEESNLSQAKKVDWVQGSAMMVSKKAIDKIGLLDERFFMYFEDTDWCRRFWHNGYKVIYLPTAKMAHYYHRASKKSGPVLDVLFNKQARTHIISALKYFWKYRNINSKIKNQNAK